MGGGIELSVLPTIWQTLALQTKGQTDKRTDRQKPFLH